MSNTDKILMGVDEVGRGALSGNVYAAAVILPQGEEYTWIKNIRDSKKLSSSKREELSELIKSTSIYSIANASVEEIDSQNILNASLHAMKKAVEEASNLLTPDIVLVDGNKKIPGLKYPQECIKNGDDLIKCIGAASIIAKVTRDAVMQELDKLHPEYGWSKNKGYGTQEHREAIMVHGVTKFHRTTFRGVAEYV